MAARAAWRTLVWVLFLVSGFAGLVYQSIWSHYLGLLLGHAAYAQSLVLAIFMGGMAAGAWLASRWSLRSAHLFRAYALVEVAIGLFGLVFHAAFVAYTELFQDTLLPLTGGGIAGRVAQWTGGALLIAPQSVLLGATFPLMSAALLRTDAHRDGETLGGLYFFNSIGAVGGAMVSTFLLVPNWGLPGTVLTAAWLNLAVGLLALLALRTHESTASQPPASGEQRGPLSVSLLAAAFITGATSFVYEIGWVRMLNQALGTTVHAFELMLAAFILGLAGGALVVKRRGSAIVDPLRAGAIAQILMGVAALLSVVVFAHSFDWTSWLLRALGRSEPAYLLFSLGSAGIAMAVMVPAAFFAGMTLPLFTMALLRAGDSEAAIGRVYASNTLGAIVGVIAAVHVLVPLLGTRLAVTLAALADVALGVWIAQRLVAQPRRLVAGGLAATAIALVVAAGFGGVDPRQQASGVFRTGEATLRAETDVRYLRDGKTATIGYWLDEGRYGTIATNGKPDASLAMVVDVAPSPDEITMILAGALPVLGHATPRNVAIIGWGSGLTTHTLLGSDLPREIHTIEIERAVLEGARGFGLRVDRAYADPRSHVEIDDARTYFASYRAPFDVIVSEPSNPWVSGVANLFTTQFYELVRRHLAPDGMLVQWIHTYEMSDELLATMIAALLEQFPHVEAYTTNGPDLLFVARNRPYEALHWDRVEGTQLGAELARVGVRSPADIAYRRIGGRDLLQAFVDSTGQPPHSDFYPTVSFDAPRARFMGLASRALQELVVGGTPVLSLIDQRDSRVTGRVAIVDKSLEITRPAMIGHIVHDALVGRQLSRELFEQAPLPAAAVATALRLADMKITDEELFAWSAATAELVRATEGVLPSAEIQELWLDPAWVEDSDGQHAVVRDVLAALRAAARRDPAGMIESAEKALGHDALAPAMRAQLAISVLIGHIARGDHDAALRADERLDVHLAADRRHAATRRILRAYAERGQSGNAAPTRSPAS